jgi:hypothetical protein
VILLNPILTPPLDEPEPPPRKRTQPHLTGPHRCPNHPCPYPDIHERFGKRVLEYEHPTCGALVSLFVALYFCPHCLEPSPLESPSWQWGQTIPCPFVPGHELVVPNDTWLRYPEEGPSFVFACPACKRKLQCGVEHALAWVVCVHCQHAIRVPPGGESRRAAGDLTVEVPDETGNRVCPGCRGIFPVDCTYCRICDRTLG